MPPPTGVEASGVGGILLEGVIGEDWWSVGTLVLLKWDAWCCCWPTEEEGVVARRASLRLDTEGCL